MSSAYTTYELEKLVEQRRSEHEEAARKRNLRAAARGWFAAQTFAPDPESEISRQSGGRG